MDSTGCDNVVNLEDSGTLELGRLLARQMNSESDALQDPPDFRASARRCTEGSRELHAQRFEDPNPTE